jgi:hypothetical protein
MHTTASWTSLGSNHHRSSGVVVNPAMPRLNWAGAANLSFRKVGSPFLSVGAYRVGRAYLRVPAPAEDRRDRLNDPTSPRNSRIPSTESAVTTPPTGSDPKMSVAATGIVPGDPSGNNTTKNNTPP